MLSMHYPAGNGESKEYQVIMLYTWSICYMSIISQLKKEKINGESTEVLNIGFVYVFQSF